MKRIGLTQNQVAFVDDEDYERLNQYKWYAKWATKTKSFYAVRNSKRINGKKHGIYIAREVLGLKHGDKLQADHIDHNTLDNRQMNLRIVTGQQNRWNRKNIKGYYWNKQNKKFHAQITFDGKQIFLGGVSTAGEARNAYLQAKKQYHKMVLA